MYYPKNVNLNKLNTLQKRSVKTGLILKKNEGVWKKLNKL